MLKISDDRLCKIKMIGEIRQNFTEASASVGLILATALVFHFYAHLSELNFGARKGAVPRGYYSGFRSILC